MMTKTILAGALIATLSVPAQAQRRYTQEEIIGQIAGCMIENAPQDWKRLIFTLDQQAPGDGKKGKTASSHKVIVGEGAPQELKPCKPDWVAKATNAFRENQDEKTRRWTGITVTLERDGRYAITYRYPK